MLKQARRAVVAAVAGVTALVLMTGSRGWAQTKFKAVTTFTVIQDIAQNVAGDAAIVESITKPGAEIHDYQPTPLDIVKAQSADLVLWNGINLERWFEKFFENVKEVPSVVVTEGIEPMGIEEGPYTGKPNPHAWMSPTQCADLRREHPQGASPSTIRPTPRPTTANAAAYAAQIKALDEPLRKRLAAIPEEQRWLVSSEGAFSYLARDYGLKRSLSVADQRRRAGHAAAGPQGHRPRAQEQDPGRVSARARSPTEPAKQVAQRDRRAATAACSTSIRSAPPNGPVPTYLELLEVTVETIAKGFGK